MGGGGGLYNNNNNNANNNNNNNNKYNNISFWEHTLKLDALIKKLVLTKKLKRLNVTKTDIK